MKDYYFFENYSFLPIVKEKDQINSDKIISLPLKIRGSPTDNIINKYIDKYEKDKNDNYKKDIDCFFVIRNSKLKKRVF